MFTLYSANTRGVPSNCLYPQKHKVDDMGKFTAAVSHDYVCAEYKNSYRSNDNFLGSDCLPFDCDNDHSDNPDDWITPEQVAAFFENVVFAVHYSRSHNQPKNGKAARPKFHVMFPISRTTDPNEYAAMKKIVNEIFPFFDTQALDAARFFFGTDNPQVEIHNGDMNLTEFLDSYSAFEELPDNAPNQIISEGSRNSTLSHFAGKILKRYGLCEEAKRIFDEKAALCDPPLPNSELDTIWRSAVRFFKNIQKSPNYVPPEDYGKINGEPWTKQLQYDKHGKLKNNLHNIVLILENDQNLTSIVFNRLADGLEIKGEVPWQHPARFWRDADDAQLICYIDAHYGSFSRQNYDIAVTKVADDRSYHPIHEMFDSLPEWDGVPRVDTLLINYLGAENNDYVRAVTKKALCAAYKRVYQPGIKFDNLIVLNGKQGIGKSTLIAKLGGEWYSDSLNLSDMNDKTAAEKLQGYWILEIGELAGMKKADIDKVKAFISRQDDKYRASFGRRVTPHPRQCIFFGTTNSENGYLRDITGNRRFWNVKVSGDGAYKPWELDKDTIKQVWAEIKTIAADEPLYLDSALEEYAKAEQREAMEYDEREGVVREYLEMLLPTTWDDMDIYARRDYFRDRNDPTRIEGTTKRETVSNIEIWCECFGKPKEDLKPSDSYAISAIMCKIEGWEKSNKSKRIPLYGLQRFYRRQ